MCGRLLLYKLGVSACDRLDSCGSVWDLGWELGRWPGGTLGVRAGQRLSGPETKGGERVQTWGSDWGSLSLPLSTLPVPVAEVAGGWQRLPPAPRSL